MHSRYSMSTGKVSTALAAAGTKSLVLLNPVTNAGTIVDLLLSCGANASQTDIAIELYRVTTLGSPAGTTGTIVKDGSIVDMASADWTGLINLTTEPTAVEKIREAYFPVNQGLVWSPFPLDREPFAAAAGNRIGVRVVNDGSSTMTSVDWRCTIVWEI